MTFSWYATKVAYGSLESAIIVRKTGMCLGEYGVQHTVHTGPPGIERELLRKGIVMHIHGSSNSAEKRNGS